MSRPERAVAADNEVQELVAKARKAQAIYEGFSQEQVDAIVRDMAKYVYDNAETLARMAVDETGIGNYEDKILKKKGKARVIWNSLKGKKSRGIIGEDAENNLVFVAKPMGVVASVCPVTNPIATPMCNGMFALKTGNAVIFAPHPKAQKCTEHLTTEFMKIVKKHGGPDNLVQTIKKGSVEKTQELMRSVDVVVATGGGAMVKSAYSSGKPSYGVGAGNVPVIIDRGVDFKDAVGKIVTGAAFDNGIICSHEQFVLTPEERYDETVKLFKDTGKVWFTDDEAQIEKLRKLVFPGRPSEQGRRRQVGARDRRDGRHRRARERAHHPAAGERRRHGRPAREGEALPRRRDPAVQDLPRRRRESEGEPARRGRGPLRGVAFERREQHPRGRRRAADQPARREPGELADGRRLVDERLRADDDARLRLVGRQLDLRELGLQAPDERVAHRQGHHEQESADGRGNLLLAPGLLAGLVRRGPLVGPRAFRTAANVPQSRVASLHVTFGLVSVAPHALNRPGRSILPSP